MKQCYDKFLTSVEDGIGKHPRVFWRFINEKRGTDHGVPASMKLNNTEAQTGPDVANLFADHFSSVYSSSNPSVVPYCPVSKSQSHCIGLLSFSEYDVMRQIKRLDIFKGAGPDGTPPVFIKRCGTVLALPLTIIYNQSLNTGVFPTEWKKARIVPVYKKGDNSDVKNYRPISILSCAAKLFERMVYPLLMNHTKPFLTDSQHGFITKRSVNTNLVTFVSDLCQEIDNGSQIDAIYTDFSSAFDKVNHCLLLRKLESFGVYGPFLEWFRSYLDKRTQTVVVRGYESLNYYADSGVPQGSHLGPLLFLLFINDITSSIRHCKFALFADDLKIYKKIESRNDMELIQSDLNSISTWCNNNSMVLNAGKCFHIKYTRKREPILTSYHIDGTVLQEVDQIRDLGVLIDSKLCFTAHIDKIAVEDVNRGVCVAGPRLYQLKALQDVTRASDYLALARTLPGYGDVAFPPARTDMACAPNVAVTVGWHGIKLTPCTDNIQSPPTWLPWACVGDWRADDEAAAVTLRHSHQAAPAQLALHTPLYQFLANCMDRIAEEANWADTGE
ncbi:unnamed protein product [Plutella xylostella]|uniref:(diamondback moth) hypothetical protein n=1 Tax=Plutella xylostella TaxID=51655 RepID=A0A8S4GBX4_PLUXY|nr:unnamed protein product [Plutella xylostella]